MNGQQPRTCFHYYHSYYNNTDVIFNIPDEHAGVDDTVDVFELLLQKLKPQVIRKLLVQMKTRK